MIYYDLKSNQLDNGSIFVLVKSMASLLCVCDSEIGFSSGTHLFFSSLTGIGNQFNSSNVLTN